MVIDKNDIQFKKPPVSRQVFFREILISQLATTMNVHKGIVLKLLRELHYRMMTKQTCRENCSFQVLNAYDLYIDLMSFLSIDKT